MACRHLRGLCGLDAARTERTEGSSSCLQGTLELCGVFGLLGPTCIDALEDDNVNGLASAKTLCRSLSTVGLWYASTEKTSPYHK